MSDETTYRLLLLDVTPRETPEIGKWPSCKTYHNKDETASYDFIISDTIS